jgi:PAS domain S-box-containing protein
VRHHSSLNITRRQAALVLLGVQLLALLFIFLDRLFVPSTSLSTSPTSQIFFTAITGFALLVYGGLFWAYSRGWEYARHTVIVILTLLVAFALPEPFLTQSAPFIIVLPSVVALVLAGPFWVIGSAVATFVILLARAGWHGVYANLETILLYGMGISGLAISQLVAEAAHRTVEARRREAEQQAQELIKKNQAIHFQASLLEAVEEAVIATDPEGKIIYWNRFAETLYGWLAGEVVRQNIVQILMADTEGEQAAETLAQLKAGGSLSGEWVLRRRDGSTLTVFTTTSPIYDGRGKRVGLVGISKDITERKQAEAVLRDSEESFRLLFANNPHPMWLYDVETLRFLEVNDTAIAYYGYSRAEFLNMRITDIRPSEDIPRLLEDIAQERQALQRPGEWRHRRRDGQVIDVEITSHRMEFAGRPAALVVVQDITERKRAEAALRASWERYLRTLDNMLEGCQIIGFDWRYLYVNDAVAQHGHQTKETLLGHTLMEVYPGIQNTEMFAALRQCMDERLVRQMENEFIYPDGSTRWFDLSIEPAPEGIFILSIDITQRKLAEAEILRLNEDLEQRVRDRTAQLEATNRELESFSYSVSHDLRAPLRAMDGFSHILLEEYATQLPAEGLHYLDLVRRNAQQMDELVEALLKFSRLGRQALNLQPVALDQLARQAWEELSAEYAPPTGRRVEFTLGELPTVQADPVLLKLVLLNLFANALKFTRQRAVAVIHLGSRAENGEQVYFVKDNGVGFDPRYTSKLFGVFQRLHRAEEYEGTGVGLATVQRIIHRHGGRVWAEAELGQGATFYFTLEGEGSSEA